MKEQLKLAGMLRLGFILAIFAAAACVMLAFVYTGTATVIAARQQADLEAALRELFPDADSFAALDEIKSPDPSVTIESAYAARKNDKPIGAALRLSRASYGGLIKIMAGVSVNGTITGVKIMEHADTPGLGANAASPSYFVDREKGLTFYGQFAGKSVMDPFEVKKDVIVITASTVTSRAVALAVRAAGVGVATWLTGLDASSKGGE